MKIKRILASSVLGVVAAFGLAAAAPHANADANNNPDYSAIIQELTEPVGQYNAPVNVDTNNNVVTVPSSNTQPAAQPVHHPHHSINGVLSYDNPSTMGEMDLMPHALSLPHASAAIAMDATTGQVLYAKNIHQRRLVASTGKLMDLYLTWRKIYQTPGAWHQVVKVGNGLRRMSYNGDDGGYHFVAGHKYTVGNLMKAAIIASSNNAAIALGQWTAGSNHKMLNLENKQAKLWGLRAHFVSASGLENEDLAPWGYWDRGGLYAGNEISAYDLAVITYHILNDAPKFLKYSKVPSMHEDGQLLYNYNEFLHGFRVPDLNVDGLKTGWTPAAGYCFVGTVKKNGHRIITVTLNDDHQWHENTALMRDVFKYSPLEQA